MFAAIILWKRQSFNPGSCIDFIIYSNLDGKGGGTMKQKRKNQKLFTSDSLMGLQPQRIDVDPFGSYTGVPEDPEEVPVQDADDL